MIDSILDTIKKLLGLEPEYTDYDQDVIVAINTAIQSLTQLGVGKAGEFQIEDATATWDDFLGEDKVKLSCVKNYIHIKTKMLFDPPTSSILAEAYNKQLSELEFRINITAESREEES